MYYYFMSLKRFKFVLAFIFCSYTGFRIISNSINFYNFENRFGKIFEEWSYWFINMPIWWPSHFIIFVVTAIYIGHIIRVSTR